MNALSSAFSLEMRHLRQSRWDLAGLTLVPALLLTLMAAMLWPGAMRDLPIVILDEDSSAASRSLIRAIDASAGAQVAAVVHDSAAAARFIRRGEGWAVVHLPRRLDLGLPRRRTPVVRIFYQASFLSAGSQAARAAASAIHDTLPATIGDGLPGRAVIPKRTTALTVVVTALNNEPASLEWYLGALIYPAVLHLVTACVCAMGLGRELDGRSLAKWARASGGVAAALAGKMLPYVLATSTWGIVWLLYLMLARGWHVEGALWLVIVGQGMFYAATAAITCLLVAGTREVASTLSVSAVYAGSALAYSGATLPLNGANAFARVWSEVLPLPHYMSLQMGQFSGNYPSAALVPLAALASYVVIAGGGATLLIRHQCMTP